MNDTETVFEIVAPRGKLAKQFRSSRFRTKRTTDVCSTLQISDIQDVEFLKGRDPAFVKQVADFAEIEVFREGETLMQEGEEGNKMYFLHRGKVDVRVGPTMKKIATLESGAVLGELALIGLARRTATITAADFCDCRSLDRHTFARLLRKFPEERAAFERIAKKRLDNLKHIRAASEQPRPRSSFVGLPGAGLVEVRLFRPHRLHFSCPGCEREVSGRQSAPAVLHHATTSPAVLEHASSERSDSLEDVDRTDSAGAKIVQTLVLPQIVAPLHDPPSIPRRSSWLSRSSSKASKQSSNFAPAPSAPPEVSNKDLVDKLKMSNAQLRGEVSNLKQQLIPAS